MASAGSYQKSTELKNSLRDRKMGKVDAYPQGGLSAVRGGQRGERTRGTLGSLRLRPHPPPARVANYTLSALCPLRSTPDERAEG